MAKIFKDTEKLNDILSKNIDYLVRNTYNKSMKLIKVEYFTIDEYGGYNDYWLRTGVLSYGRFSMEDDKSGNTIELIHQKTLNEVNFILKK